MGKNLNMNSMDKLFSGLTGKEQPTVESGGSSNVKSKEIESVSQKETTSTNTSRKKIVKQHICATVDVEKMEKIRAIAETEALNINAILDLALSFVINKYEELHGTISVKKPKKGDVGKVFNL